MSSEIPKLHSSSDADEKQKRLKKYDKFNTNSLRRDVLLSKFDRTLVVEKAKFEPTSSSGSEDNLLMQTQSAPITPTQHADALLPKMDIKPNDESNTQDADSGNATSSPPAPMPTYALTMSPSAPTLSTTANSNNSMASLLTSNPLTTSHSVNDHKRRLTPVKSEVISSSSHYLYHCINTEIFHFSFLFYTSRIMAQYKRLRQYVLQRAFRTIEN